MIDLSTLKSLIAVRDLGSVAAAAESMAFTPSAVSQQIKRLEGQTGTLLLERVGRRVLLTEHGRSLAERGESLLADLEGLESFVTAPDAPVSGRFRITSFSTANRGLVAPLLAGLATTAPGLAVTTIDLDPWESIALVERGGADLAIVHNWRTVPLEIPASLMMEHLLTDPAELLVHAEHPLAGRATVTPNELTHETWVGTPRGTICHEGLCQMFAGTGSVPQIAYFDGDFSTHIAMVENRVAVALVPKLGRDPLPPTVIPVPVIDPMPQREVQVVWRRSTSANRALALVRRELETVVAELHR